MRASFKENNNIIGYLRASEAETDRELDFIYACIDHGFIFDFF